MQRSADFDLATPCDTILASRASRMAALSRHLEDGSLPVSKTLGRLYELCAERTLARRVALPAGPTLIGIGGSVLGGGGKTPVAIAIARSLALRGLRVALVSHAYRSHAAAPLRVHEHHRVPRVGDDALVAARELATTPVQVWTGLDRNDVLSRAAQTATHIVIDSLLQTRPTPLSRSFLVLNDRLPFGSARCPPAGDLRAPVQALLSACDEVVVVRDTLVRSSRTTDWLARQLPHLPLTVAWISLLGAVSQPDCRMSVEDLQRARTGVLLTTARPHRVLDSLRARSVYPVCAWFGADHRSPNADDIQWMRRAALRHRLDAWLCTPKCHTHLSDHSLGAPLWTLQVLTRLDPQSRSVLHCPA